MSQRAGTAIPAPTDGVASPGGRIGSAVAVMVLTVLTVVVPAWVILSVTTPVLLGSGMALPLMVVGMTFQLVLPAVTAALWSLLAANIAGVARGPMVRGVVRTSVLTLLPVAFGIDMSQVLIDVVWPWHRLAVHVVFGIAFTVGIAVLMGRIARRVELVVGDADAPAAARRLGQLERPVTMATACGVAVGAVVAVWLGWAVVPGMGMRMLLPLYLVLATGTAAGGAVLGWWLPQPAAATVPGRSGKVGGCGQAAVGERDRSQV